MKKSISLLLTVCMLLTVGSVLTSCTHQCSFAETWTKDDTAHWHACTDETCTEISEKADHTWNEGVITTTASQEADGVKTYTCTVCQHTKTEPVAFTGMTEQEWSAAFSPLTFENFTYTETSTVETTGILMTTVVTQKFAGDKAWMCMEIAGQLSEQTYSGSEAEAMKETLLDSMFSILDFEDFQYDANTKTYTMVGEVYVEELGADLSTATLKFENGKLVEFKYTCQYTEPNMGMQFDAESTVTLTDYGTTVVPESNGSMF